MSAKLLHISCYSCDGIRLRFDHSLGSVYTIQNLFRMRFLTKSDTIIILVDMIADSQGSHGSTPLKITSANPLCKKAFHSNAAITYQIRLSHDSKSHPAK